MGRVQLVEFEDLEWFPANLRRYMQDFLAFMGRTGADAYSNFAPKLKAAMEATGEHRIVDLCSGSSGPVEPITRMIGRFGEKPAVAVLTDLYPNLEAFERVKRETNGRVDYVAEPVDATRVPAKLEGFRLLCNGFHHFPPEKARQILADAVASRRGIAVVEVVGRAPASILSIFLGMIILLVATPFVKPFRLGRLFFTYLVPAVPLFSLWDGFASCLRVYSPEELRALIASVPGGEAYHWDIGRVRAGKAPAPITYLIGYPTARK